MEIGTYMKRIALLSVLILFMLKLFAFNNSKKPQLVSQFKLYTNKKLDSVDFFYCSPNGRYVADMNPKTELQIYDLDDHGKSLVRETIPFLEYCKFNCNSRFGVVYSYASMLQLHDLKNGGKKVLKVADVVSYKFCKDGRYLAIKIKKGMNTYDLRCYDLKKQPSLVFEKKDKLFIENYAFRIARYLAVDYGGDTPSLSLYDLKREGKASYFMLQICERKYSADGKYTADKNIQNQLKLYKGESFYKKFDLVDSYKFSSDGRYFGVKFYGKDVLLKVYDLKNKANVIFSLKGVNNYKFSPDSRYCMAIYYDDANRKIFQLYALSNKVKNVFSRELGDIWNLSLKDDFKFSSDGKFLLCNKGRSWRLYTTYPFFKKRPLWKCKDVGNVCFSNNGRHEFIIYKKVNMIKKYKLPTQHQQAKKDFSTRLDFLINDQQLLLS